MALQENFSQGDLIGATGFQYPQGVCLGLVAQWLISMKNNDEKQFWKDLFGSLAKKEDTPLLGRGYAKNAIRFQGEYLGVLPDNPSTGEYTRMQLKTEKLTFDNAVADANSAFAPGALNSIVTRVLNNDCRYFILGIRGTAGGHAIGIQRDYKLIGKGTTVQIFDPNFGKFVSDGDNKIKADLADIGNRYNGGLHRSYVIEGYAG